MISVVFSTKNGASRLHRTLKSMVNLDVSEAWELLIVDNGSTDESVSIIESYKHLLPMSILEELKPGKNAALNKAISYLNPESDIVVLTDDDVRVDSTWLEDIRRVADANPTFDIFGGNIIPEWEVQPEQWILNYAPLGHLYAIKDDDYNGSCLPGKIWGPNMFVRKHVFEQQDYWFNENVGPNGTPDYPMGSETEFTSRMSSHGYKCWSSDLFRVFHWIPKNSLNYEWIIGRAFRLGKGVTLANFLKDIPADMLTVKFKYYLYSFIFHALSPLLNEKRKFWYEYKKAYSKGCLVAIKLHNSK